MQKGRVIQSTGSWYHVDTGDEIIKSRLPGRFRLNEKEVTNPIAVGDWVEFELNDDGTGNIDKIHDRENYITRQATHGKRGEQILVANLDQACVVQSIKKPKVKEGFIDRFLVTCEAYEVKPVIILNKIDLAKSGGLEFAEELSELYTGLGYTFLITSIDNSDSLQKLKEQLKDKTSAFIGPSGVGKTSLVNAIDPSYDLKVKEVSDFSNKGKHTTTYAQLIPLSFGGYLADTPGIREFGLVNIEPWELSLFFPEMLEPRKECQFNNCTHAHEPKCGVAKAFEDGEIAVSRYNSYLNMLDSL
ncbi:MAG: ribosome small subunit-dependent GTPase A [Gracilimonas sp.]|uniref:ribosome small subunit-dependent GTPase A n=1 Tax=Gracilimonas TaxID=649462 RepID=UPI001B28AFEC|nr:ribosome small subunit-dependent GTPase A [Gracilimonas sp.]MBO6586577.1 ribosome small subunit-dependent GTPase A [Gracilimonas sp.]MBO6615234.1 ribosome small subunit-dependent GTPase A [Gracilimonas sp.]